MPGLEVLALALGVVNGALLVIKPAARFHSRLDVLDARMAHIEQGLARLEKQLSREKDD